MECAVQQRELYVEQRIAGECAFHHARFEGFFDRTPVFTRYATAGDFGLKLISHVLLSRLNRVFDLAVLTRTTRLFLVGVGVFDQLRDRLAIRDLRLAH